MRTEVTARHMELSDSLKAHAQKLADRLAAEFPRMEHCHIILDVEKYRHKAEVVVQGKNHIRMEADFTSNDMYASMDGAMEKIEKRLRKEFEKVHEHRVRPQGGE